MNFRNVLVIENDPFHFEIVNRLLTALSISGIHHAENGETAIKMLEENKKRFDLILCDYLLGDITDITGVDVILKARKMPAYMHTPIIVMTAETKSRIAVEVSEAGATLFLKKPFSAMAFKERLEMALATGGGD